MIVGVIGAGAWGTALSVIVARGGSDVVLWSYDGKYKEFDDVEMPSNIQITTEELIKTTTQKVKRYEELKKIK